MMNEILTYIANNWISWIFAAMWGIMGIAYHNIAKKLKEEQAENRATAEGIEALLRNEIIRLHNNYMDKGYCPIYGKENIKRMYEPYHKLGGNDVATRLVEEILKLPTELKESEE